MPPALRSGWRWLSLQLCDQRARRRRVVDRSVRGIVHRDESVIAEAPPGGHQGVYITRPPRETIPAALRLVLQKPPVRQWIATVHEHVTRVIALRAHVFGCCC